MRVKRGRDGTPSAHPTRLLLVAAAADLVAERGVDGVFLDDVVERACLSRGAVYHHFADFADLLEAAVASRYAEQVGRHVAALAAVVDAASSPDDLMVRTERLVADAVAPHRRRERMLQVRAVAMAEENLRFAPLLAPHVARVAGETADLFVVARDRGVLHRGADPSAVAAVLSCLFTGLATVDVTGHDDGGFTDAVVAGVRALLGGAARL